MIPTLFQDQLQLNLLLLAQLVGVLKQFHQLLLSEPHLHLLGLFFGMLALVIIGGLCCSHVVMLVHLAAVGYLLAFALLIFRHCFVDDAFLLSQLHGLLKLECGKFFVSVLMIEGWEEVVQHH